jgi:hypothetical protein
MMAVWLINNYGFCYRKQRRETEKKRGRRCGLLGVVICEQLCDRERELGLR